MKKALLSCCVALAGCVGESDPGEPEDLPSVTPPPVVPYVTWDPDQGRHILGKKPDALLSGGEHFKVSVIPDNRPGFRISVNAAGAGGVNGTNLVADDGLVDTPDPTGTDPWFIGMILNGPDGQLKIRGVAPLGTNSTLYYLDYRSVIAGNPGPWEDYCGAAGGGAIAISGYYDSRRIHHPGPFLSFPCENGVAQKCERWGYPAGNAGPSDENWKFHQACTAMANADYCRAGKPYTREETPIRVRDFAPTYGSPFPDDVPHPIQFPGNPDTFYFEAGWRPGDLPPVCLSKIRWASLPPNPCPAVLPDPRFSDDRSAKFCDDMTMAEIAGLGAYIVNGSKMMDAPLGTWRNPSTGDVVQTIRGFYIDRDGMSGPDASSTLPFTGYTQFLGNQGMILRNLTGTLDEATDMYKLYMQVNPATNDRVVAHDPVPDHVMGEFEGYTFQSSSRFPNLTALKLCSSGTDYRTLTGTLSGCSFVSSLKYAMEMP
jgi:hypothetical protein